MTPTTTLDEILAGVRATEEIKIKNKPSSGSNDPRVLKFKVDCSYNLRLLLNLKAEGPNKLFQDYAEVGFNSRTDSTGKYINLGRVATDEEYHSLPKTHPLVRVRNLIGNVQWEHYSKAKKTGDAAEEKMSFKLIPQRKQLANAFLVDVIGNDEESLGKKLTNVAIRYAAKIDRKTNKPSSDLYKKIYNGVVGEKAQKIGKKALLLDEKGEFIKNGKDLIVKVIKNAGGWADYSESEFDDATEISLSKEKIHEIQESVFDLSEFIPEIKTEEEIKQLLDEHWFGITASSDEDLDVDSKNILDDVDDTDIPGIKSGDDDLDSMIANLK